MGASKKYEPSTAISHIERARANDARQRLADNAAAVVNAAELERLFGELLHGMTDDTEATPAKPAASDPI